MRSPARLAPLAACSLFFLVSTAAEARPGTHAPAVSTWDTRASSVVFPQLTFGSMSGGGHFTFVGYNANFSDTSGNLSAQFGLHYANLNTGGDASTLYGGSGSATAVLSVPVMDRYENGVPKLALGLYGGGVPTVIVNGNLNYVSIPLTIGVGIPASPARWFTITPWFEAAPSYDLDSYIETNPGWDTLSPETKAAITNALNTGVISSDIEKQLINDTVKIDKAFHFAVRGGAQAALHLDDDVSVQANFMVWQLGGDASTTVVGGGGTLIWRWDDIVPAVLPPERRLERESCDAIAERFQYCPQYRELREGGPKSMPGGPQPGTLPPAGPQPGALPPVGSQPGTLPPAGPQPGALPPVGPQPGAVPVGPPPAAPQPGTMPPAPQPGGAPALPGMPRAQ